MNGAAELLWDSPGEVVVEVTVASRLDKRGVRRTLLLSDDMALRLALRPRSPLPCLEKTKQKTICLNQNLSAFL